METVDSVIADDEIAKIRHEFDAAKQSFLKIPQALKEMLKINLEGLYDWLTNKTLRTGYFVWAMTAYGAGLLVTYVALNLMDGHGQPALLYIVPFILGTLLNLGTDER
ncbi:putative peptidase A22B, signal peptide peptidase [Rosa chinensis]|uniref:Putative peptidase A22B, signal peptide peptidase n=1 Tax=Rosa chinensis TaxID=74649 RepID=A0A2P6SHF2_ROSCH|nr:putative peptidase A22B, signal peptide peptidase [Rosa chinensis]